MTDIHKFSVDGLVINYRASGSVRGNLGWDAQRTPYRMGEQDTDLRVLTFTGDEVKKLRDGHYSAALLFQTSSDWADAVTRGAEDEFKTLGVEIAGLSNSNFSASDQAHAVQTIMAKKPSGIVTWPINPESSGKRLPNAPRRFPLSAWITNSRVV